MRLNGLPEHIEKLVKHLRQREDNPPSLTEMAAVTEILIRTMDRYFNSVDLKIYQECQNLTDYISNARKEIAALEPNDPENAHIPRAGKELDAIVRATEEATNTIMSAAEEIMAADTTQIETYQQTVNDAVMRIFEACSFQDITGQRISKVVETLTHIEEHAKGLRALMDVTETSGAAAKDNDIPEAKRLLNGPALEGEGINQSEVDALLNGETISPPLTMPAPPAPAAKKKSAANTPAAAPRKIEKIRAVDKAPENASGDTPANDSGHTTQDDIDALFG